jgi:hypothetical protein
LDQRWVDVELLALAAAGASWAALAAGVSLFPSIFAAFAVMALIGLNRRRPQTRHRHFPRLNCAQFRAYSEGRGMPETEAVRGALD